MLRCLDSLSICKPLLLSTASRSFVAADLQLCSQKPEDPACSRCLRQLADAFFHSCRVLNSGSLECAGDNSDAALGLGNDKGYFDNFTTANALASTPISSVGCGTRFTCALAAPTPSQASKVFCFGYGGYGQMGDGKTYSQDGSNVGSRAIVPVEVQGLKQPSAWFPTVPPISQLAVSDIAACVLYDHTKANSQDENLVQCWGYPYGAAAVTVPATSSATALALSSSSYRACIITREKNVACWYSFAAEAVQGPQYIPGLANVVHISVGGWDNSPGDTPAPVGCAIMRPEGSPGSLWCWGLDGRFKGLLSNSAAPWQVQGLPGSVVDAAVGVGHACALVDANGGQVYCWGANHEGALGQGYKNGTWSDIQGSAVPLLVKGLPPVSSLFSRTVVQSYTCAMTVSQRVWCWGSSATRADYAPAVMTGLCA
jgi:hypothetical protein